MTRLFILLATTTSWTTSLGQDAKTVLDKYFQHIGGREQVEALRTSSLMYTSYGFYPKKDTTRVETNAMWPDRQVSLTYHTNGKLRYESVTIGDSVTLFMMEPYPTKMSSRTGQAVSLSPATEVFRLYSSGSLKYGKAGTLNGVEYQTLKTNFPADPLKPNRTFYFDPETGLLAARKVDENITYYKDYRPVSGVLFPFVQEQYLNELLLSRDVYEKVNFNVELAADEFAGKTRDVPPLRKSDSRYNRVEYVDPKLANGTLGDLLEGFRGQRILIDLWATWCGPCKYEFTKYDDRLYAFLEEKGIRLLFISFDKPEKESQWRKDLLWFNLNGYHLMAGKNLETSIKKEVNKGNPLSIPRYILVNEKGEILSGDMGKPSSPEFRGKVEELLH